MSFNFKVVLVGFIKNVDALKKKKKKKKIVTGLLHIPWLLVSESLNY